MLEAQQKESSNVGVVLIARQTSSRLPNKVLLDIDGKNMLEIILGKVLLNTDKYIFAVPDNYENRSLRSFLEVNKYNYYAGSENNVLERFIESANFLKAKYIQRLNCDNLLFSPDYMKRCYEMLNDEYDVHTNVRCKNHSGSSVEIVKKEKCHLSSSPTDFEREHVFPYFYSNNDLKVARLECPKEIVFPIDTNSDFKKAKSELK